MRESALKEFMPAEPKSDFHREIAHVLFIDIVGYSKMLIDEQSEALQALNEIVRKTEPFRVSEKTGKLIRIPAGDGMALLFFNSPEAPVDCALEISKVVRAHPNLRLRMGVHSGPVDAVRDVNDQLNVAGAGINAAQRVMDCGDAGHILLSKRVAEDLAQYREWRPYLHDLGEVEVKHGARIPIVNLYGDEVGNPQLPDKLKRVRATKAAEARASRARGYLRPLLVLLAVALPIIVVLVYDQTRHPTGAALGKSIAVLPFDNLSLDADTEYLSDGIPEALIKRASTYLSDLGYCYAVIGRRPEALAMLEELKEKYARRESIGQFLAGVYAGLGDKDQAFAWLERDFQQHSGQLPTITWRLNFEELRRDPRYAVFVRRMGLQP